MSIPCLFGINVRASLGVDLKKSLLFDDCDHCFVSEPSTPLPGHLDVCLGPLLEKVIVAISSKFQQNDHLRS